jgi:signal peptidase I
MDDPANGSVTGAVNGRAPGANGHAANGATNGAGTFRPTGPPGGAPNGEPRHAGPTRPDGPGGFPGGPHPQGGRPGGGAHALPSPSQVPAGPLSGPRHSAGPRPPAGSAPPPAGPGNVSARPPGPSADVPADSYPTDTLPVDDGEPRPSRGPDDLDATVVIGAVVPGAAADRTDAEAHRTDTAAAAEEERAALLGGRRRSRRERRAAGETTGNRPAAEYRKEADALSRKKPRTGRRRRPAFWRELPLLVVVALLLTFLIQTFLAKVYVIPSGSMELTLHGCPGCNNDRVLVDKVTYRFSDPQPGDVVVFRGPDSWISEVSVDPPSNALAAGLQQLGSLIGIAPPDEKDFVKRVIAVGGQTVQCCDSRNRVMVDGQPLDEPYVYYLPAVGPPRQEGFGPVTVPAGQLWMMGDSRNNSSDSRVAGHGPIAVDNVIGKARLVVLPVGRFGWIEANNPQGATAVGMAAPGAGAPLALGLLAVAPLGRRWRRPDAPDRLTGFLPDRRRWH